MRLFWLLLAIISASVQAGDSCDDPITAVEVNQCAQSAYQIAEEKLWLQYRAQECGALYDFGRYGTKAEIRDALHWSCMIKRTEQRASELTFFGIRE